MGTRQATAASVSAEVGNIKQRMESSCERAPGQAYLVLLCAVLAISTGSILARLADLSLIHI